MAEGKLQREVKKKRPFDSAEQEALLNVVRTGDRLQIHFTRLFREHELTPSQYNVLRILRGEGRPMECMEIAERTVAVVPGITGLIDRLEKAGLVTRQQSQEDRRVYLVTITACGLALLAGLDEPVLALHRKLLGHLTQSELEQLIRLLEKARSPWEDAD
ncbi:MAG: MarR family transcriptional regulator [Planctomycetes bacterium]|nr:MarR family transcriptional regulator [Planctomycetota bacterium]